MIEFKVDADLTPLIQLITDVVSPKRYWLHTRIGGVGWSVYNIYRTVKTVHVEDPHLATLLRLKL